MRTMILEERRRARWKRKESRDIYLHRSSTILPFFFALTSNFSLSHFLFIQEKESRKSRDSFTLLLSFFLYLTFSISHFHARKRQREKKERKESTSVKEFGWLLCIFSRSLSALHVCREWFVGVGDWVTDWLISHFVLCLSFIMALMEEKRAKNFTRRNGNVRENRI